MRKRYLQISIHTSAREVTKYGKKAIYHLDDFNPHFRKGSDQGGDKSSPNCDNFNPHFRKGSDSWLCRIFLHYNNFNPHFRKGSDGRMSISGQERMRISIHTSAREVTIMYDIYYIGAQFQSTLPQGKWQPERSRSQWEIRFQSTLPQGKWPFPGISRYPIFTISIHTSAREVTITLSAVSGFQKTFQSTLPQGKWHDPLEAMVLVKNFNPHFRKGSDDYSWISPESHENFNPHFRKGSDDLVI